MRCSIILSAGLMTTFQMLIQKSMVMDMPLFQLFFSLGLRQASENMEGVMNKEI